MRNPFAGHATTTPEAEAYADRCLRRIERRLLLVRAEQAYHQRMLDLAKSDPQSPWIGVPQKMVARLEQLAQRLIRRRDRYLALAIGLWTLWALAHAATYVTARLP